MTLQEQEQIKQFIQEELQNLENADIDKSSVTTEMVREIIREEVPALLAKSITTIEGNLQLLDGRDIVVGGTSGTRIGTSTSQKLGFFAKAPVVQPTALTAGLTSITHTAPGTDDFAIQDLTTTTPFGFVTKDEGNTVLKVILNLQTKVQELETKLENLGLIALN